METKSFVKILRKVIREEVRSAVKEILGEQKVPSNRKIYYLINTIKRHKKVLLHDFIFPSRLNLFYFSMFGKKGVIEHQVLIPKKTAKKYLFDQFVEEEKSDNETEQPRD